MAVKVDDSGRCASYFIETIGEGTIGFRAFSIDRSMMGYAVVLERVGVDGRSQGGAMITEEQALDLMDALTRAICDHRDRQKKVGE